MDFGITIVLLVVAADGREETTLSIPGPRQVHGKVLKDGNEFTVDVSMIPYRSFGDARNSELAGAKLRIYASAMIAKINGVEKIDAKETYFKWIEKSENLISANIIIKITENINIKNANKVESAKNKSTNKKIVMDKFKAGADMAETIMELKKKVKSEIDLISNEKSKESVDKKIEKISAEIKIIKNSIEKDINDDLLIFETEIGDGTSKGELKKLLKKTFDFLENELSKSN